MQVLTEEEMLNRVRSLLKCASRRGYAARSATPGSDIWKILFNQIDVDGSGALDFSEIKRMVRADLRLPERVVSDYELHKLFIAIDDNGNGTVDFAEFMEYTSQGKVDKRPLAVVLRQISRVVRLALRRRRIKLCDLEDFCYDFAEIDFMSGKGQIGQEEHLRFFRDHMLLHARECSTSNLNQLFKMLCRPQERMPKTVLATDFMDAFRFMASTDDFGSASPPNPHRGLIGGMQGYLPEITSRPRPGGFLIQGSSADPPFCFNGRDLPPNNRLAVNDRNFSTVGERKTQRLKPSSSAPALSVVDRHTSGGGTFSEIARRYTQLGEAPSPVRDTESEIRPPQRAETKTQRQESKEHNKPWAVLRLTEALQLNADFQPNLRPQSTGAPGFKGEGKAGVGHISNFGPTAAQAASAGLSASTAAPVAPPAAAKRASRKDGEECRSAYFVLDGAEALNRVEHRLFHAGVDVRGHFHRRHAEAARAAAAC